MRGWLGTDVGEYARKYGGVCLNTAINIRQEFILTDENKNMSLIENDNPKFIRTFVSELGVKHNFDGFIHGGLGSSASAAVALIAGVSRLKGENLSRYEIAEKAWDIEVNKIGLFGGRQDQFCATFGGFNLMKFDGIVGIEAIPRGLADKVMNHLLLFDTGIRRTEPKIQENLKEITLEQKEALDKIKELALEARTFIYKGDVESLGKLLDKSWEYKKKSNKVTTEQIDLRYQIAKKIGAWGGKLIGSGGGGYMIFLADKKIHKDLIERFPGRYVDHGGIDWTGVVTRIL